MTPRKWMRASAIVAAFVVPTAAWAAQQQPAPQASGTAQPVAQAAVIGCAQAHPMAERTIDMTNRRLEAARQANSPAAMRAAIDDMQSALRQLRTEIAPCAGLQSAAAEANPNAGDLIPAARTPLTRGMPAPTAPVAPMDHSTMPMGGSAAVANPAPAMGAKPAPAAGSKPAAPRAPLTRGLPAPAASATVAPMDHSKMPMGGTAAVANPAPAMGAKPVPATGRKPAAPVAPMDHSKMSMGGTADNNAPAAAPMPLAVDQVCGLKVDPGTGPQASYQGQTYHFCSEQHRQLFLKDAAKYVPKAAR